MNDILLLHGALASRSQFDALAPLLGARFTVHTLDFEGHGARPGAGREMRAEHLAENVLEYLDGNAIERAGLFGYSMGGYVACVAASLYPERVTRVATLGTRYLWDEATLERELRLADPETMLAKVPRFVESLSRQHTATGWESVVAQTRALLRANRETDGLTAAFLGAIQQPVRVMVGDRDVTAGVLESVAAFQALPNGELEVLPSTPHPLNRVDMARLAASLSAFFAPG